MRFKIIRHIKDSYVKLKTNWATSIFSILLTIIIVRGGYLVLSDIYWTFKTNKPIKYMENIEIPEDRIIRRKSVLLSLKYNLNEEDIYQMLNEKKNEDINIDDLDKTREQIEYYSAKYGISTKNIASIFLDLKYKSSEHN